MLAKDLLKEFIFECEIKNSHGRPSRDIRIINYIFLTIQLKKLICLLSIETVKLCTIICIYI